VPSCEPPTQIIAMEDMLMVVEPSPPAYLKASRSFKRQFRSTVSVVSKEFHLFWYLPREIIVAVLSYLRPNELSKSARVCKEWRLWAYDEALWKTHCIEVIGKEYHPFKTKTSPGEKFTYITHYIQNSYLLMNTPSKYWIKEWQ